VKDSDPPTSIMAVRTLTHGTITHGDQFLNLAKRDLPPPTTVQPPAWDWPFATGARGGRCGSA